jgi:hypothetical protein
MPQPNVKEQIVAGPLQNVSVQFRNEEYIADRVFPILDGADPKAKITIYNRADWFRDEAGIRTAGSGADTSWTTSPSRPRSTPSPRK